MKEEEEKEENPIEILHKAATAKGPVGHSGDSGDDEAFTR